MAPIRVVTPRYKNMGTLVNAAAIVIGCIIGLFFKRLVSEKMNEVLVQALALCTMATGILGAAQGGMAVTGGELGTRHTLIMILSMVIGTVIGEIINIQGKLDKLGAFLERRFSSGKEGDFSRGFVTATLTVCVGAMAIMGALNDGLRHDPTLLYTKSILDLTICVIYASTLGIGAMFSAVPLLIYQGGITVFARFLEPLLSDAVVAQMSFIGSVLIMGIGFNFIYKPKLRLANMLPAVFIPPLWYAIVTLAGNIK